MPALKLIAVASLYGGKARPPSFHFNQLVRQITSSPSHPTATATATATATTSFSPSFSEAWMRRWRITSWAPFPHPLANDNNKANKKVGFRCYSSEDRTGGVGVGVGVGVEVEPRASLVTDMGPSSREEDQWYDGQLSPTAKNHRLNHHRNQSPLQQQQQPQSSKFLTLPTILTIGRVAAVPLLVGTFYVDNWWGPTATTGIFIAAAITDWLDGYLARKMKLGTAFGAFLDPVADKLMVAATLVLLCTRPLEVPMFGQVPWLLTGPAIAIIGREITMSAVREWAAQQSSKLSEAVAVNNLGKWKTATQMTALTILLATRDGSLVGAEALKASGVVLLYISAWLAVWSLFVYMRRIWRVLLM